MVEVEITVPPGAAEPTVASDSGRSPSLSVEEKLARARQRIEEEIVSHRSLLRQQLHGQVKAQYSVESTGKQSQ